MQDTTTPDAAQEQIPAGEDDDYFDDTPCSCGGAWHAVGDHCVNWTCPGCEFDIDCPLRGLGR
jgi:hypothetical protein